MLWYEGLCTKNGLLNRIFCYWPGEGRRKLFFFYYIFIWKFFYFIRKFFYFRILTNSFILLENSFNLIFLLEEIYFIFLWNSFIFLRKFFYFYLILCDIPMIENSFILSGNSSILPPLDRLSTAHEPWDASSYSWWNWNCTCGKIGSCILAGTVHVARHSSAYSQWNCTCGKIGSRKVELYMWE